MRSVLRETLDDLILWGTPPVVFFACMLLGAHLVDRWTLLPLVLASATAALAVSIAVWWRMAHARSRHHDRTHPDRPDPGAHD